MITVDLQQHPLRQDKPGCSKLFPQFPDVVIIKRVSSKKERSRRNVFDSGISLNYILQMCRLGGNIVKTTFSGTSQFDQISAGGDTDLIFRVTPVKGFLSVINKFQGSKRVDTGHRKGDRYICCIIIVQRG